MSVLTVHPDYTMASSRWNLIRKIVANNAVEFLRTPDIEDPIRSEQYKKDGILTNFTNLTKVGLTGLVFRKKPKIKIPDTMSYLYDDVTGTGINIWQFSQHSIGELIQMGRYGYLVDKSEGGRTYIRPYIAENIRNWKTAEINGRCVLSLVVLQEFARSDDNIFSQDTVSRYRVLYLNADGKYAQDIYEQKKGYGADGFMLTATYVPTTYNGSALDFIPFVFAGSENNDWNVDYQPLYDMAVINLAHYKNSCDYEESIFICGQPYLVVNVGESSKEDFDAANSGGISFGSRKALIIASGGDAKLLQSNPNQLVAQAMKEKIEQAAAVGARLIAPPGQGRETAEAAKIRYGSQHSALYTLTSNYSWAMTSALNIVAAFEGVGDGDISLKLSDEFYDEIGDANMIAQMILMSDRGIISKDDIRDYGRKVGIIGEDRTNEDIEAESETVDPLAS